MDAHKHIACLAPEHRVHHRCGAKFQFHTNTNTHTMTKMVPSMVFVIVHVVPFVTAGSNLTFHWILNRISASAGGV